MKFVKTKIDGLDGLTKVRFRVEGNDEFQLQADRRTVEIQGTLHIGSMPELEAFAQMMSQAWTEHTKLKPKLSTNLSGH